jgi:copper chaperone CopZ
VTVVAESAVRLAVGGMTCPTCEKSLERVIGRLPGVLAVSADHRTGRVDVTFATDPDPSTIRLAAEDAGYDLEGMDSGA